METPLEVEQVSLTASAGGGSGVGGRPRTLFIEVADMGKAGKEAAASSTRFSSRAALGRAARTAFSSAGRPMRLMTGSSSPLASLGHAFVGPGRGTDIGRSDGFDILVFGKLSRSGCANIVCARHACVRVARTRAVHVFRKPLQQSCGYSGTRDI